MPTSYLTIINGHQASIPSWNGVILCGEGCNCSTDGDLSRVARYGNNPSSGLTREYTPYSIETLKSPSSLNRGRKSDIYGPVVRMTPYYHNSLETINSLFQVPQYGGGIWRHCSRRWKKVVTPPSTCSNNYCAASQLQQDMGSWIEQYDYNAWYERSSGTVWNSVLSEASVQDAIAETQSESAAKSFKDYDALTDALQFKQLARDFSGGTETFRTHLRKFLGDHSTSDLKKAYKVAPKDLLRSAEKGLRKIGKAWLVYRYLVMPLIYSMKDIQQVLQRWQTTIDKASRQIEPTILSYNPPSLYILASQTGSIRITSTVACKYSSDNMARAARVSINPFITAWELIPYSFVVDWFVNVGDWVTNTFSADFANSAAACTAVQVTKTTTYTAVWTRNSTVYPTEVDASTPVPACWPSGVPARTGYTMSTVSGVVRVVNRRDYSRTLFSRRSSKIIFNPRLNWRRLVDTGALSLNQIKRLTKNIFK